MKIYINGAKVIFEKLLKEHPKNISQDIVDDIMANILNDNSALYSDDLIIHVVKSLCYNLLKPYGDDFEVIILSQKKIDKKSKMKNTVGLTSNKTIYLERETLLALRHGDLDIINTIMHERRHVRDNYLVKKSVISYEAYQLIMESVVVFAMKKRYYHDNYWHLYEEVDARRDAAIESYNYIKKVCPKKAKEIFSEVIIDVRKCDEEFKKIMRNVKGKHYNREELFDRILKKYPEFIQLYPVLAFYYTDKGNKISAGEIIKRRNYKVESNENSEILSQVVALDSEILKHRMGTKTNIKIDLASLYHDDVIMACANDELLSKERNSLINSLTQCLDSEEFGDNIIDLYDSVFNQILTFKIKFYQSAEMLRNIPMRLYCFMMQERQYQKSFIKRNKK